MNLKNSIDNIYCHRNSKETNIAISGWCFETTGEELEYIVKINNQTVTFNNKVVEREDVGNVFSKYENANTINSGFEISIRQSNDMPISKLELFIKYGNTIKKIYTIKSEKLNKMFRKQLNSHIDNIYITGNVVNVVGWAATFNDNSEINYLVEDKQGNKVAIDFKKVLREDVFNNGVVDKDNINCGFHIRFTFEPKNKYKLIMKDMMNTKVNNINITKIKASKFSSILPTIILNLSIKNTIKGFIYFVKNGPKKFKIKLLENTRSGELLYEEWFAAHKCSTKELQKQMAYKFGYEPKISILVPAYKTAENFLKEMIDSVRKQTYSNWELCIADGSEDDSVEKIIKEYSKLDGKIKYKHLLENLGISENTNEALALATGDFIALLDHDDLLAPNAMFEIVKEVNNDSNIDVIYTDEDKISMDSSTHFQPYFKSDFNIDLLRSNNYICHLFVVRKSIVDKVGGFNSEFDGSQDYNFIFRCTEEARRIYHIPKILYYWRMHKDSVAQNPDSKMYAYDAGKRAIEENLRKSGLEAQVFHTKYLGFYHVKYNVKNNPLVSIIIPNKDHIDTLKICIDSIIEKSTYQNYEIIIVENNSTEGDTFEYYKVLEKIEKIKVIYWEDEFNYSKINNFGVSNSSGEYIILLNNDTEIINSDWIEGLLGNCQRDDVGIVGAKLYYPDDTIQHAGVIIGLGGVAGHAFTGLSNCDAGYFGKALIQHNVSAVTAACLMIKRRVFVEINGFEEGLKVAFNDVDFCLKVREAGYLIVFNPNVELYHYESKSRGYEDTLEKIIRFESEIEFMKSKWKGILTKGDPFYNENLTLTGQAYSLKNISEK